MKLTGRERGTEAAQMVCRLRHPSVILISSAHRNISGDLEGSEMGTGLIRRHQVCVLLPFDFWPDFIVFYAYRKFHKLNLFFSSVFVSRNKLYMILTSR